MPLSTRHIPLLAMASILPALALPTLSAPALSAPANRKTVDFTEADVIERMRHADGNGDGVITRPELASHRANEWPRMDRNGDGYFSRDDLPGFARDRWNSGRLASMRQAYDANRDNRISRAEFIGGPTLAFDKVDANRDDKVSTDEMETALAAVRGR